MTEITPMVCESCKGFFDMVEEPKTGTSLDREPQCPECKSLWVKERDIAA